MIDEETVEAVPIFTKFPKIPREMQLIITEKLDGTNAQIIVPVDPLAPLVAGSRNRYITPGKTTDNFGFAAWVAEHAAVLRRLGPGTHYGEWWGQGIGRGYGLSEKRFWLFNYTRPWPEGLPENVGRVPVLLHRQLELGDELETVLVATAISGLRECGSVAAPRYMYPEGVVINIGNLRIKKIFDKRGPSPEENN